MQLKHGQKRRKLILKIFLSLLHPLPTLTLALQLLSLKNPSLPMPRPLINQNLQLMALLRFLQLMALLRFLRLKTQPSSSLLSLN